jgi:hypothetical protein
MAAHRRPWPIALLSTLAATALGVSPALGLSFDEVIRAVDTTRPTATTQVLEGRLYAGTVRGTITDQDGDNTNYDDGDTMTVTLSNAEGKSLEFPNGTSSELEQFVTDHTDEILEILFPSGIATSVAGRDDSQSLSLGLFNSLVAPSASPRDHASASDQVKEVFPLRQVSALLAFEDFEVDGFDGTSAHLVPGYDLSIDQLELGFSVPFKYTTLDDQINTDSYNLGFELHASYPVWRQKNLGIYLLGGGLVDSLVFTSDAMDGGFLRYGGFTAVSARAVLRPFLLSGGASYSLSRFDIVGVSGSEEIDALVAALEDRPLDQNLNVGLNIGLPLGLRYLLNLRVSQTEALGPSAIDEGKQGYTTASASLAAYFSTYTALDLGYQRLFGMEDAESQSVFLLGRYNF